MCYVCVPSVRPYELVARGHLCPVLEDARRVAVVPAVQLAAPVAGPVVRRLVRLRQQLLQRRQHLLLSHHGEARPALGREELRGGAAQSPALQLREHLLLLHAPQKPSMPAL